MKKVILALIIIAILAIILPFFVLKNYLETGPYSTIYRAYESGDIGKNTTEQKVYPPLNISEMNILPSSVPSGSELAITGVIKNLGKKRIENISIQIMCNNFCDASNATNYGYKSNLDQEEATSLTYRNIFARGEGNNNVGLVNLTIKYDYDTTHYTSRIANFIVTPEI